MMQLLCNGERLDLPTGASLQFTHANPLFAFDSMACERTTSFSLPATPTNDRLLALSRVPAFPGSGMRARFSAQLIDGVVVKNGYLYVTEWDGKEYKAIFITGELLGLKAIKDAGSVKNFVQYDSEFYWNAAGVKNANAGNINFIDLVKYVVSEGAQIMPSANVKQIVIDALSQLGGSINWANTSGCELLRIFNANKLSLDESVIHLKNTGAGQDPITPVSFLGIVNFQHFDAFMWQATAIRDQFIEWDEWNASAVQNLTFYQWSVPYDCVLTFPNDFPNNYFLITGDVCYNRLTNRFDMPTFLGGYSFLRGKTTIGDPLAGRSVKIPADTPFILLPIEAFIYPDPTYVGEQGNIGYDPTLVSAYDFKVRINIDEEYEPGENVPYNAILPNVTLVDLLKAIAATSGTVLNYENGVISFDMLDFSTWGLKDISNKLVKRDSVSRKFADYAQRNKVQYDSGSSVRGVEKIVEQYDVPNETIEEEKDLQTLKMSEGGIEWGSYQEGSATIMVEQTEIRGDDDSITLARCDSHMEYMLRVPILKNAGIQQLCTASTQYKVQVRMALTEYNTITAKTLLMIDGMKYAWTERQWQKDIATFTLAKI